MLDGKPRGAETLLDGRRGNECWRIGGWLGWLGVDADATAQP